MKKKKPAPKKPKKSAKKPPKPMMARGDAMKMAEDALGDTEF